jgi:hypothetical protein
MPVTTLGSENSAMRGPMRFFARDHCGPPSRTPTIVTFLHSAQGKLHPHAKLIGTSSMCDGPEDMQGKQPANYRQLSRNS